MFIRIGLELINAQHIRKLRSREPDKVEIEFVEGRVHTIECPGFDDLALTGRLVPAPPNFFMLYYEPRSDDVVGEESGVSRDPIIAFMVGEDEARPVVASGLVPANWEIAVLRPDGKVDVVGDCTLDSVDEFKAYRDKQPRD